MILEVKSKVTGTIYYVDNVKGTCTCPAWRLQSGKVYNPCLHLIKCGYDTTTQIHKININGEVTLA